MHDAARPGPDLRAARARARGWSPRAEAEPGRRAGSAWAGRLGCGLLGAGLLLGGPALATEAGAPGPDPAALSAPTDTPAPLTALSWVLGSWSGRRSWESWAAAGDVYWGLSLPEGGGWEVMRLDVHEGVVRFLAQPGGREPAPFTLEGAPEGRRAVFTRPGDDFPTRIRYRQGAGGMAAAIGGPRGWGARFRWTRAEPVGLAELAARDRAWEAEVAAGGSAAWVAGFDPEGFMTVPGRGKVPAGPAMRELMAPDLDGRMVVRWAPTAGGVAPGGELGFTVGVSTWALDGAPVWRGSYLTVWKKQADGGWRALFDTGDELPA